MLEKILKHLNPAEREGLENLVSLTFVFLAFVYLVFFLGDFYAYVRKEIYKNFPEFSYFEYILKYGVILVVPVIYTRAFLFAHDSLANGQDRYAEFFRSSLPSRFLKNRLSCDQGKADELWFKILNAWRNRSHPRNAQWYATFRRTYSCRFIYHLQRWLFRAAILFSLTLAADEWYRWLIKGETLLLDDMWFVRLVIIMATTFLATLIWRKNKIRPQPTGCWAQLIEIENSHKAWLEQEIINPSGGNYDRAWELAREIELKWAKPNTQDQGRSE